MIEMILGTLIALNFGIMFHIYSALRTLQNKIEKGIDDVEIDIPSLDEIKNEIIDALIDAMSNLQTPTFLDHIGGAAASILHARAQKMMATMNPVLENPNMTIHD